MKQKIMNSTILTNETGRSMVEMLGVLAIIGVLSVGGLYGYGVAMKKHKANELLHQASMLATTISSQILTDKPLNVQDFGGGSANFSETVGTPNDEQFTLEIKEVDSSVCEQLKKMKGGMTRDITCGTADANGKTTATLKFNNNLSSTPVASDYNDDTTGGKCEGAGYQWCDGKCKTDCCDGKCTTGQTCVSGSCMNAECKNEDCRCSNYGTISQDCSAEKPYCIYDKNDDGMCASTAEGATCYESAFCSGTDAPYCNYATMKCSKSADGAMCNNAEEDCGGLPYCGGETSYTKTCRSTFVGIQCYVDSQVCQNTDAPYCNYDTRQCSKSVEGAICTSASQCGDSMYCVYPAEESSYKKCASTAVGSSCYTLDSSYCRDTDAPYCNYDTRQCSKSVERAVCSSASECGDSMYCMAPDSGSWGGYSVCVSTAVGSYCRYGYSDCQNTDAPYCANEKCSKSPEGAFCNSVSDCGGLPYCINHFCSQSATGKPCSSHDDCKDTDALYCVDGKCNSTAVGASCLGDFCSGTDAPYCHSESQSCSKSPEGAMCDNAGEDCGGLPYCIDHKCHSTAVGVTCWEPYYCKNTDAPYCVPYSCSKSPEGAMCSSDSDCGGEAPYCAYSMCSRFKPCSSPSDCKGTDVPYCNASNTCSKTQEYGGFCDSGQDCGSELTCNSEGRCV